MRLKVRGTFSDFLRVTFKWFLDPIGRFLNRLGLTPITVTIIGVIGSTVAAFFVARGQITTGGIIMLIAWPVEVSIKILSTFGSP